MSLGFNILNQIRKNTEKNIDSSSSRIKNKTALIISVFAAIFSFNAFLQAQLNNSVLTNTIKANDTWAFYQAKSIKQTQYEIAADAVEGKDQQKYLQYRSFVERYETEPKEGKQDLMILARSLETERDIAKKKLPWIGIGGSIMQIAIVLLTASILSSGIFIFYTGIITALISIIFMSQGIFLWM